MDEKRGRCLPDLSDHDIHTAGFVLKVLLLSSIAVFAYWDNPILLVNPIFPKNAKKRENDSLA